MSCYSCIYNHSSYCMYTIIISLASGRHPDSAAVALSQQRLENRPCMITIIAEPLEENYITHD